MISLDEIERRLKKLREGRFDPISSVTLAASVTTTIVTHPACSSGSWVGLMPATAAAKNETPWITPGNGLFTITHLSTTTTRTYRYMITTPAL